MRPGDERAAGAVAPRAPSRVLATLDEDGSRRALRPRLSPGRFLSGRRWLGYALIAVFTALPLLRVGGRPAILLDIAHRRFTILGTTFLATDTALLMLLVVSAVVCVFLLTALYGRVWCGFACPQTVYMEFAYRAIERRLEGASARRRGRSKERGLDLRRLGKHALFLAVSVYLANTFLAYFVGVETLLSWVASAPWKHPLGFAVVALTTGLMWLDFGYLREQVCAVICPYGRLQSVLLDRGSLMVAYDERRGEPRGRIARGGGSTSAGACIDCGACVRTCPAGIDIRDGLQMECIACAQCVDACDAIMDRVRRPRGLVRFTSKDALEGRERTGPRPRLLVYPVVLATSLLLLGVGLARRPAADLTVLRAAGAPFTVLPNGLVSNQLRVKVQNRTELRARYRIELGEAPHARLIAPENPVSAEAHAAAETTVFVLSPRERFAAGTREVELRVVAADGTLFSRKLRLLGPETRAP